ncbi:MAG: divergent PAP2 family protein [Oscillospiraceae bacterium]|nr:divergent PAP2 family protein [Oscillospiraceae bacterium]
MGVLRMVTSNYVINCTVSAWILAQVLKTVFTYIGSGKLQWERMVGAGGMPSAHSAGVVALTISVARRVGYTSPEFGIALAFAVIVMYDAMGVRRAAGEQAKVLNKMIFEFSNTPFLDRVIKKNNDAPETQEPEDASQSREKELKEYLGHTPFEVLCGALLGILVAIFIPVV